jgi:hypothetical protein
MSATCIAFEKWLWLIGKANGQSIKNDNFFYSQICNLNKKLKITEYFGSKNFYKAF